MHGRLSGALFWFWTKRGQFEEGRRWPAWRRNVLVNGVLVVRDGKLLEGVFAGQPERVVPTQRARDSYRPDRIVDPRLRCARGGGGGLE